MRSSGRMSVELDIPAGAGKLDCWGSGPGGWWALLVWMEQVMPPRGRRRRALADLCGVDARDSCAAIERST
jgi:hypothetical protein